MTLTEFVELSAALTGYPATTLQPSRDIRLIAEALYAELSLPSNKIPADTLDSLTQAWASISSIPYVPPPENKVQQYIMDVPKITRLAQNIIYMWYLGIWYDLSKNPNEFTVPNNDHVISSLAYVNGLVWGEMGAHPMGFSTGNFGYWANVPVLPQIG